MSGPSGKRSASGKLKAPSGLVNLSSNIVLYPNEPPSPTEDKSGKFVKPKGSSSTLWNYNDGSVQLKEFQTSIACEAGVRQGQIETAKMQLEDAEADTDAEDLVELMAKFKMTFSSIQALDNTETLDSVKEILTSLRARYETMCAQDYGDLTIISRQRIVDARKRTLAALVALTDRVELDQVQDLQGVNNKLHSENQFLRDQNIAMQGKVQGQRQLQSSDQGTTIPHHNSQLQTEIEALRAQNTELLEWKYKQQLEEARKTFDKETAEQAMKEAQEKAAGALRREQEAIERERTTQSLFNDSSKMQTELLEKERKAHAVALELTQAKHNEELKNIRAANKSTQESLETQLQEANQIVMQKDGELREILGL